LAENCTPRKAKQGAASSNFKTLSLEETGVIMCCGKPFTMQIFLKTLTGKIITLETATTAFEVVQQVQKEVQARG
jgi:hypothetical protein